MLKSSVPVDFTSVGAVPVSSATYFNTQNLAVLDKAHPIYTGVSTYYALCSLVLHKKKALFHCIYVNYNRTGCTFRAISISYSQIRTEHL